MKYLAAVLFNLMVSAAAAQSFDGHTWVAPYQLPTPDGWSTERFAIPIGFAPQINYTGVEDIRFAPGWSKADSSDYWTYAFLWFLDADVATDTATIQRNLTAYYTGLVNINRPDLSPNQIAPVVALFNTAEIAPGDVQTYRGTIQMTDYLSAKPILLYCKVHVKKCPGKSNGFLFYKLSPQPFSHSIWNSLDVLWLKFSCNK